MTRAPKDSTKGPSNTDVGGFTFPVLLTHWLKVLEICIRGRGMIWRQRKWDRIHFPLEDPCLGSSGENMPWRGWVLSADPGKRQAEVHVWPTYCTWWQWPRSLQELPAGGTWMCRAHQPPLPFFLPREALEDCQHSCGGKGSWGSLSPTGCSLSRRHLEARRDLLHWIKSLGFLQNWWEDGTKGGTKNQRKGMKG